MGKHNTLAELFTRRFLCCFTKYSNWIAKSILSWREWAEWQHCHIWDATRVFGSWTNTGTHSSSRPGDGTAAAPTDVAHPRGDGFLNWSGPGLSRQQQPVQQTPTVAQSSTAQSERLTMDTKCIPAAPLDWKSWNNRVKELAGFKGW